MAQPTIGKFEFPFFLTMGIADHTWANMTYFPAFTLKAEAGAFYRFSESWSFGLTSFFMWTVETPGWKSSENNGKDFHGLFQTASLAVRYHF